MTLVTRLSRALVATFVVLAGLQLLTAPAQAADNGAWSVTPTPPEAATPAPRSYFVLEGDPGAVLRDKVRLRNYTRKPISFQLYGADGYNTAQDGFFALKGADEPQIDAGGWVRMPISSVQVAPMTQVDVPFQIKIPDNATPGDHVGGVVAMNKAIEGVDDSGGFQVGVQRAVGARLYLRVSGPTTPGLKVSDVRLEHDRGAMPWTGSGEGTVTYRVENIGNLRLSPTAVVKLSGLGGRNIDTVTSKGLVDLLPGQSVVLTESVDGIRWADRVTTTVTLSTPEGATAEGRDVTWLVPWLGVLLFLVLLAAAGWLIHRKRTETRRGLVAAETAPLISVPAER